MGNLQIGEIIVDDLIMLELIILILQLGIYIAVHQQLQNFNYVMVKN
jgi:hypothetical protein